MATRILVRRDTTARWTASNPILAGGEPGYDTTTGEFFVGDGSTRYSGLPKSDIAPAGRSFPTVDDTTHELDAETSTAVTKQVRDNLGPVGGVAAQPLFAALPRVLGQLASANDGSPTPLRIIGQGSSVGVGATLPDPSTQAPVARLASLLGPVLVPLGNKPVPVTNASVNGSAILQGFEQHYPAAKAAAGGTPNLLVLAYGMNDGMPGAYHTGQTFPSVYTFGKKLVEQAQSDGADVVIFTTPHPRTDIMTDAMWAVPGSSSYPSATPVPAATQSASQVQVRNMDGDLVAASYRHLRVNEALRRLAADTGSVLVDAEKYWLRAVKQFGLAALFNASEYAHPNLLGHQQSYWLAINELVASVQKGSLQAAPMPAGHATATTWRVDSTTRVSSTTLVDDSQLSVAVGAGQVWEIELGVYYTGGAGDLRVGLNLPAGSAGRLGVTGFAPNATGVESGPSTHRSNALPDTYGLSVGCGDADSFALARGIVRVGSSGGIVMPQWSQDTQSTAATTIYRDTYMKARRLS